MSEWFIARSGEQEGPFSAAQIGAMLANGELRAGEAHAWKEGMPEWKTIAESGVLAEASLSQVRPHANPAPSAAGMPAGNPLQGPSVQPASPAAVAINPYSAPTAAVGFPGGPAASLDYPGLGRLAYFGLQLAISVVAYAILFVVILGAGAAESFGAMLGGLLLVVGLAGVAGIYIGVKRVQNLGMSGWAILWSLVPILSIWISWRMFACPAGYEHHKQLDTAGKVLTGLMIGLFVLAIVANIIAATASGGTY